MMSTYFVLAVLATFSTVLCHEDDVFTTQYNADNFAEEVAKKNHFVMFYAPWCGHCQRLGPTWEELAEANNKEESNVHIAKVDCTTDNKVCLDQDVTGYPTLKLFKVGDAESVKYRGMRDLASLTSFINEHIKTGDEEPSDNEIPSDTKAVLEHTDDTFEKAVASGNHFIKFYAPWCGHCQKLAPTWETLPEKLGDLDVKIGKIDCTQNRETCSKNEIKGYPTLLWFVDGEKIEKYAGARSVEAFKEFLTKKTGGSVEKVEKKKEKSAEDVQSSVIELNHENFQKIEDTLYSIVEFYTPWCGHCKHLAPTWEDLGKAYADNKLISIVKVNCAEDDNKELCNSQDVQGFPTIVLYKAGKFVDEYKGSRTLEGLKEFLNKVQTEHDEL